MTRFLAAALTMAALATTPAFAADVADAVSSHPPAEPYQKVSDLVPLPEFLPGIGELFVDPETLPAGPFVAYDHDGRLVSTIYMIPLSTMTPDMNFDNLAVPGATVDHTDISYNAGHPGVAEPHIHIVLWHVPVDDEASVAE